jgi:hypothetical protein
LFVKLEDALEVGVLGSAGEEDEEGEEEEEVVAGVGKEEEEMMDKYEGKLAEPMDEDGRYVGDVIEQAHDPAREYYHHHVDGVSLYARIRPPSRTPSLPKPDRLRKPDESTTSLPPTTTDLLPKPDSSHPSESLVSYLRSQAQHTQSTLAEKRAALAHLRQKHDLAMKRLDKLQGDLERVAQKWEAEERDRIQSESTSVIGKRKRDDSQEGEPTGKWRRMGLRGVEWSVLFGVGVVSAIGINKLNYM